MPPLLSPPVYRVLLNGILYKQNQNKEDIQKEGGAVLFKQTLVSLKQQVEEQLWVIARKQRGQKEEVMVDNLRWPLPPSVSSPFKFRIKHMDRVEVHLLSVTRGCVVPDFSAGINLRQTYFWTNPSQSLAQPFETLVSKVQNARELLRTSQAWDILRGQRVFDPRFEPQQLVVVRVWVATKDIKALWGKGQNVRWRTFGKK